MTVEEITVLAGKVFNRVEIVPAGEVSHSKLNRSDLNKAVLHGAEKLVVCRP
jgi:hypothetical protein